MLVEEFHFEQFENQLQDLVTKISCTMTNSYTFSIGTSASVTEKGGGGCDSRSRNNRSMIKKFGIGLKIFFKPQKQDPHIRNV